MKSLYRWLTVLCVVLCVGMAGYGYHFYSYYHDGTVSSPIPKIIDAGDGQYYLRGEWIMNTRLAEQPRVNVQFQLPCDKAGNVLPSAEDMVFYGPGSNCRATLSRTVIQEYARSGLGFYTIEITSDMQYLNDPVKSYPLISSGWYDVIFRAQDVICDAFKLKKQKLLMSGESAGGRMVQHLGATFPDKFEAVAVVGSSCHLPVAADSPVSWLIINTWLCYGSQDSDEFASELAANNKNVLRIYTIPDWNCPNQKLYFHTPSLMAYTVAREFLVGIAALRRENHGSIPAQKEWPACVEVGSEQYWLPSQRFADLWMKQRYFTPQLLIDKNENAAFFPAQRDKKDPVAGEIVYLTEMGEDRIYWLNVTGYLQEIGYNVTAYRTMFEDWRNSSPFGFNKKVTIAIDGSVEEETVMKLAREEVGEVEKIVLMNLKDDILIKFMKERSSNSNPPPVVLVQSPSGGYYQTNSDTKIDVIDVETADTFNRHVLEQIFPRRSTIHKVW